jgi:hypothetical protein
VLQNQAFLFFYFFWFVYFCQKSYFSEKHFKTPKYCLKKKKKSNIQPQEAFHRTPKMVVAAAAVGRRGRGWTTTTPTKGGRHRWSTKNILFISY